MKTIVLLFLLPVFLLAQQTYVPDDVFEWVLIERGYDELPLNDSVPTANIDTVTTIGLGGRFVSDLTGLEDFISLKILYLYDNGLTVIDVSNNTALEYLDCQWNDLTNLDLSNNPALKYLNCHYNQLIDLDLKNNPLLEELDCSYNNLTDLDLSENVALEIVSCYNNKLGSLDLCCNPKLSSLSCGANEISNLDLSKNLLLEGLWCFKNNLTNLDLSNNLLLEGLWCSDNQLENLDFGQNQNLEYLRCTRNKLTDLDLSKTQKLELVWCSSNALRSLNLKNGKNHKMNGDMNTKGLTAGNNPDLTCIQVDDSSASESYEYWHKDDHAQYSEDCGYTGVEDLRSPELEIEIFPNPAEKNFTVSFELDIPQDISLTLTDLSGREIKEIKLENQQYVNEQIDVSEISTGVYYLRISFVNGSITRKIVVGE